MVSTSAGSGTPDIGRCSDPAARVCAPKGYALVKRILDLVFAVALLVLLSPLLVLIALLIRLDSSGPAIYSQQRVGAWGRLFTFYKFRTMKTGTPVLSTAELQQRQLKPYTRIGPFLRKTSLDELPQLINVIKGEMSFVGPRPALPTQNDVNTLRERCGIQGFKPGITGLAQARGRDDLDAETKVNYDLEYCRNISFLMDARVIAETITAVLSARGNK